MLKNFLRIAWRNFAKHKIFSLINIAGLAIGLTCFMLIGIYVLNQLSYDRYAADAKNIYRVHLSVTGNGDVVVYPNVDNAVGEGMKNAYPEIRAFTKLSPAIDFVKYNNQQVKENRLAFADSNFLSFFSIPLVEGNERTALIQPNSVVISRAFEKKYFGNEDAIGKSIIIGIHNDLYKVTGIFDQVPERSHFHFDAFLSLSTYHTKVFSWSNIGYFTYVLLNDHADPEKLEAKFPQLVSKYVVPEIQHDMGVSLAEAQKSVGTFRFSLMPLRKIHLYSHTKMELEPNGDIQYIYIFSALAFFILLLACVNFTNLSTAQAARRAREVGIRKVMGSIKKQLVVQFLSESIMFSLFAMLCTYALIFLLLPVFNHLANENISMSFFFRFRIAVVLLFVSIITGLLAGCYPAFFLSSFNAIKVLKGSSVQGTQKKTLQNGLIIFQFFVSITLFIATLIISQQLHFMQNKKLGYDKNEVLYLPDAGLLGSNQQAFKQQLLEDPRVSFASISRNAPGSEFMDGTEIYPRNENSNGTEIHANIYHVDEDYLHTLGIQLVQGRNFLKGFKTDSSGVIINEAAVKELGWTNNTAVGKTIVRSGQRQFKVLGVMADFNYATVKQKVAPLLFMLGRNSGGLLVKVRTSDISGFLKDMKTKWDAFHPDGPLEYNFLDEQFATMYASEHHIQQIFSVFTALALFIACLGLFGLSAFVIEQRTKEIGIRKVLGASVQQLFVLVSKDFLLLVLIAFIIAAPLSLWAMNIWLQDYAYRVPVGVLSFLIAGGAALFIAILTVSVQALRASAANPVKSLRTE